MNNIFEFFSCFDWISPAIAVAETIANGPGHTFYVGLDSGFTGAQCESILKAKGVKVYGRCIANGDAFFQVGVRQAAWAEYLLLQAGAPLKYHLFSERNRRYLK
jgi:hypothetical protein